LVLGKDPPDWLLIYKPQVILAYILYTPCTPRNQSTIIPKPYLLSIKNAYEQKKRKHPGILAQTDKLGKNPSRKYILIKLLQPTVLKPRINPV
jgi:hypothetical protein